MSVGIVNVIPPREHLWTGQCEGQAQNILRKACLGSLPILAFLSFLFPHDFEPSSSALWISYTYN